MPCTEAYREHINIYFISLKQVYNNGKSESSDKTISRKGYEKNETEI